MNCIGLNHNLVEEYIKQPNVANELDIFREEFAIFKLKNNIAIFAEITDEDWGKVDNFLLYYSLKLASEKKVLRVITEYGIMKGYNRLMDFYKNETQMDLFKNEYEILNYVHKNTGNDAISTVMVFAILRDEVSSVGLRWW